MTDQALAEAPTPAAAPAAPAGPEPQETLIRRRSGWQMIDVGELWRYRELLFFLAWRDVKVRYKQAALGAAWAVLQPLATMIVFSLFFSRLNGAAPGNVPYPLFVFCGLLPWTFFAQAVSASGQSIVGGQQLITKIYFPRLLVPMSAVGAALADFAVGSCLLGVFLLGSWAAGYATLPGWGVLLLPLLVATLSAAAVGVGSLLAALSVAYRDFRHVTPFLVQLWLFATPCIYMRDEALSPALRAVLPLNPAYGLIANVRAAALGGPPNLYALAVSGAVSAALLLAGLFYFRRVEQGFADTL